MSRSCHNATFSIAGTTAARMTRARPVRFSVSTGLRLCGMADEPFWPGAKYSSASSTSVRWRCRISTASRSIDEAPPPNVAKNMAGGAGDDLGRGRLGLELQFRGDILFDTRVDIGERADGAGNGAGGDLVARH